MADNRTVEEVGRDLKNFIGPQRPNKIGFSGSTLGAGINYSRELGERSSVGVGLHSGGAFDGPILTGEGNYNFLQGKLNTTSLGTIKGTLGVNPLVGVGPDTAVGAVMLKGGVTFNDRVELDLGVGPAVFLPLGDEPYRPSTPYGGALAKAGINFKF